MHWRLQRELPASPMSMEFAPTPPRNQSATEAAKSEEESSPEWEQSRHTAVVTTKSSPRVPLETVVTHIPFTQNTRYFLERQRLQQEEEERAQQARRNTRPQYPHQFYAYAYDRGNGRYTRLIPADMLPPLVGVPAYESDISRLFVLELPQALDADERNTNVEPVQTQVTQGDAVQVCRNLRYSPNSVTTVSSSQQKNVVLNPFETHPRITPKQSWVHD